MPRLGLPIAPTISSPVPDPTPQPPPKPLMRSLGLFVGHLFRAATADPRRQVVSRTVEESNQETPQGHVTLRRTTIEEVEVHPPPRASGVRESDR